MKVAFNGVNKEIVVLPGIEQLNVQVDLYSDWKEWVRLSDNAKYPAAFRTFGGDPTIQGQFAPSYYFLINGWKLIAEDVSVEIGTNLYTENEPIVEITNSAVSIRNSDAATIDTSLDESLDYSGTVNINTRIGVSSTLYPAGTIAQPVNNLQDAITIADFYGISNFSVRGDIVIDQPVENFNFYGSEFAPGLVFTGLTVSECRFFDFNILGTMSIPQSTNVYLERCGVSDLYGFNGVIYQSTMLGGTLTLSPNHQPKILLISETVATNLNSPDHIIEIPGGTYSTGTGSAFYTSNINVRHYAGEIGLSGSFGTGSRAEFDMNPGKVNLLSGITGGEIVIRGIGTFDNHVTEEIRDNIIVDTSGFYYDIEDTSQKLAYNEAVIYDSVVGVSGSRYPIGTPAQPVNNLDDALKILDTYSLTQLEIRTPIVIDQNLSAIKVFAKNYPIDVTIDNVSCVNTTFQDVNLSGTFSNSSDLEPIYVVKSITGNIDNFYGLMNGCFFEGDISIGTDATPILTDCRAAKPGIEAPILKFQGTSASVVSLGLRAYSGDIRIKDFNNAGDVATLEFISGRIVVDETCLEGIIYIRGVGTFVDERLPNSNTIVVTDGLIDNNDFVRIETELNRIGVTTDNISQSVFNIGNTVSIINTTTVGISQSVFNIGTTVSIIDNKVDGLSQSISEIEDSTSGLSQSINSFGTTLSLIEGNTNEILNDVTNIGNTISIIDNKIDGQNILLEEIAGLVQKNFRITNQVYDINGLLETATIRTFANSTDATNNVSPLYEYNVEANYDSEGKLIDYLVIDV